MTLWHYDLIPYLPTKRLASLHRDVCLCRGKGWGGGGPALRYVWTHGYTTLHAYHSAVISEMVRRGWGIDPTWCQPHYRGKLGSIPVDELTYGLQKYPEMDDAMRKVQVGQLMRLLAKPSLWFGDEMERFVTYALGQ